MTITPWGFSDPLVRHDAGLEGRDLHRDHEVAEARDVGDAEAKVHTLGVNWYANEAVKISAAYLNAKTEKVTNATAASGSTPAQRTGDDSGDGFVVRAQYVF